MKRIVTAVLILLFPYWVMAQSQMKLIAKENSQLPDNDVWSIAIDQLGNKWFGTAKSGLVKYNHSTVKLFSPQNSIIKGGPIGPLFVDSKGLLWISTSNPDELFTIAHDSVKKINSALVKGLGSIIAISQDANGAIYVGGSSGLIRFDGKAWSKVELPGKEIVIRTIAISPNNTLAIGHNEGLLIRKDEKWQVFKEENEKLQLSVVRSLQFISDTTLVIGYGGGMVKGGFSIKSGNKWVHYNKSNSAMSDNTVRSIGLDKKGFLWMATNNGLIKFTDRGEIKPLFFRDGVFKNVILDIKIEGDEVWVATNFGVIELAGQ